MHAYAADFDLLGVWRNDFEKTPKMQYEDGSRRLLIIYIINKTGEDITWQVRGE
jgi:hypothetical protein